MNESKKKNTIIIVCVLLVIAIALLLGLIIYNTPSNRLSRQLDLGKKYLEEENYEQAVVEFDKAIAIDPMCVDAYMGKAEAYIGMGDYEQAAATYATAVQAIPDEDEVWSTAEQFYLEYAQIYMDEGDLERAVDVLQEGDTLLDSDRAKNKLEEIRKQLEEQQNEQEIDQEEAATEEVATEEESVTDENASTITVQGTLATENTAYQLNTAVELMQEFDGGGMLMGSMDVTFSKTRSKNWGELDEYYLDREITPNSKDGYEWRNIYVDIETVGSTSGGSVYYNWAVNSDNSKNWGESVRNANVVTNDFTVTYNGTDYTDCKLVIIGYGDIAAADNGTMGEIWADNVYVLLPQGYDGNVYYTIYGTTINGDSTTRNDGECVTYIF